MKTGWRTYHTVWAALFLGWIVSYIDRTLTGPVVTWMINNNEAFLQNVENPHALGGLIGSLFFAGYMLIQFPGGYFGDKYGYRLVILISIFWAGVMTLLTGLIGGLFWFVALRVLTGLGEGAFYSNDRTLITRATPPEKMGLGMGIVISGLTLGLTIALLAVPPLVKSFQPIMGNGAWRAPFLIMSVPTFIVGFFMIRWLRSTAIPGERKNVAILGLMGYSSVFLVAILIVYESALRLEWDPVVIGIILTGFAAALIVYVYWKKKSEVRPILFDRNLILIYLSAIPILWHLWFYAYWSVAVVEDVGSTFMVAAMTASFNAIAGLIGFPLGGMLSDRAVKKGKGRKGVLVVLTVGVALISVILGAYIMSGGSNWKMMALMLFISGLLFFALQPVSHAMTAELAPATHRGAAFGMWNLIAEIRAVLAPVISGAVRDAAKSWTPAIMLDAALMGVSASWS